MISGVIREIISIMLYSKYKWTYNSSFHRKLKIKPAERLAYRNTYE